MRLAVLLLLVSACTPAAMPWPAGHPARADAEPGRLAGPPAALRRGVARPAAPREEPPPVDHGQHEGHR